MVCDSGVRGMVNTDHSLPKTLLLGMQMRRVTGYLGGHGHQTRVKGEHAPDYVCLDRIGCLPFLPWGWGWQDQQQVLHHLHFFSAAGTLAAIVMIHGSTLVSSSTATSATTTTTTTAWGLTPR